MRNKIGNAIEYQAPTDVEGFGERVSIFLGGSIEMGVAEEWQKRLILELSHKEFTFMNPRRIDWDSSWVQTIDNEKFVEQVRWEITHLELADIIVMYFDPNTKSPISLLELGLHAKSKQIIVLCPEGFWRKGNVDFVCQYYNITQVDSFDDLIKHLNDFPATIY
jgi:hypothetical protein